METVQQARQVINAELDRLARFNDPRGYYYLCGACSTY